MGERKSRLGAFIVEYQHFIFFGVLIFFLGAPAWVALLTGEPL